jgi:hypothetical protein
MVVVARDACNCRGRPISIQSKSAEPATPRKAGSGIAAWLATAVVASLSMVLMARLIWYLDRGFDFTDQSFYLMMAQRPETFDIGFGIFGYGLHSLYELTSGSISAMQRLAAVMLVALGALLGWTALDRANADWRSPAGVQTIVISATLPLVYYATWLAVPGYNWFALVAAIVLLAAILLLLDEPYRLRSTALATLAAVTITMARPLNAIGFAVLFLSAIILLVPSNWRLTQIGRAAAFISAAVVVLAAVLPVSVMVAQTRAYIAFFGILHPTDFSLADQQLEFFNSERQWFLSCFVLALSISLRRANRSISKYAKVVIVIVVVLVFRTELHDLRHMDVRNLGSVTGTTAFCALTLATLRDDIDVRLIAALGIASLVPWAATLGSAARVGSQLVYYCGLSGFIACFAIALAARFHMLVVTAASCVGLYVAFSGIGFGLEGPYRLAAAIPMQTVPTAMGWGAELKLDAKTNAFVSSLQAAARDGGFCQGDMAIDLSASLPGAVFVIGGRMPVFPWILGGYDFSEEFARAYLERVGSARLARSWLVTSTHVGAFTQRQLESFGVDFTAFQLVADLRDPVHNASVKLYAPVGAKHGCD